MVKVGTILISFAIGLWLCCLRLNAQTGQNIIRTNGAPKRLDTQSVVWTKVDIRKNTVIGKEMIELKPIDKIPDQAIGISRLVVGRRAKRNLLARQIVFCSDIADFRGDLISSVYLAKDLPAGTKIKDGDVYEVPLAEFCIEVKPGPKILSDAIGRTALVDLFTDKRLVDDDLKVMD